MDDMSQYMQQMNAAAASQSLSDASVAAQNAKEQAKTEYQRFKQGVVEGVSGPLGIDLLEKTVEKGGLKVAEKVGLGNAFKDWQEGGKGVQGLANAARGAIGRATGKAVPEATATTPKGDDGLDVKPPDEPEASLEPEELGEDLTPQDLIDASRDVQAAADPAATASLREASADLFNTLLKPEPTPSTADSVPKPETSPNPADSVPKSEPEPSPSAAEPGDDFEMVEPLSEEEAGKAAAAVSDVGKGESTLAKLTAASAEDDFNPYGLVITAGLAIGTLFAGIFGHHRDGLPKHPPVPPPVMNASTQFGVAQ